MVSMIRSAILVFALFISVSSAVAQKPGKRAKNVIVFLADAGGLPTVSAASLHGYGEPQKLFLQSMPNIALSDTSTATNFVTDSAAGMTAIVTGVKTQSGVISQGPDTVRGKKDGTVLKTLLEYAEEKGLLTGVVTNTSIADATPAACYAHSNDRGKQGEIFLQVFNPRFGDGVDVVLGNGRSNVYPGVTALGQDLDAVAKSKNRPIYASLEEVPADNKRPVAVLDGTIDVAKAARMALDRLEKSKKGYFLMVEWDSHTDNPRKGLDNLVNFDKLIREVAGRVNLKDTLLLFVADHSFEMRITGGKRGTPILAGLEEWQQKTGDKKEEVRITGVRVGRSHTGEEVVAAAMGPGADQVRGFLPNTRLFDIMLSAYGWKPDTKK